MLLNGQYQNAYVTKNLDASLSDFRKLFGAAEISVFPATIEVTTPKERGKVETKLAFAWAGGLQYELIEPVSGLVDIYSDALPNDRPFAFHHVAMRTHDWNALRVEVDRLKLPVVLEGGHDKLKFLFVDARELVGHYLEYVWMTPEVWTSMGGR